MGIFKKPDEPWRLDYSLPAGLQGSLIGAGNFADCFRCQSKVSGRCTKDSRQLVIPDVVLLKEIDLRKIEDINDVFREVHVQMAAMHPNICALYEAFEYPTKHFLIMELACGGELFDRVVEQQCLTEKDTANVMAQLSSALHYLTTINVIHRDVKPENILMANTHSLHIKLCDFGLSRYVPRDDVLMKTACGTPGYVAPEILGNRGYSGFKVDVWSMGVILYILLCGFAPFYEEELPALFHSILHGRYDFPSPEWDGISTEAVEVVKLCLTVDPQQRPSAKQVGELEWVKGGAPSNHISTDKLEKWCAKRKLKQGVQAVLAMNRLRAAAEARAKANVIVELWNPRRVIPAQRAATPKQQLQTATRAIVAMGRFRQRGAASASTTASPPTDARPVTATIGEGRGDVWKGYLSRLGAPAGDMDGGGVDAMHEGVDAWNDTLRGSCSTNGTTDSRAASAPAAVPIRVPMFAGRPVQFL